MSFNDFIVSIPLSGHRFNVTYSLSGPEEDASAQAQDICIEQTIEFPADLVKGGDIRNSIFGRIESFQQIAPNRWESTISYAIESAGNELTQLINVIFGNFSLKPNVRVEHFELPEPYLKTFNGPRFGIPGIRRLLNVTSRPLFCTALKPMGLSAAQLADLAYQFALGGVDMIKDDHGLANQPFAPFKERVERCAEAVKSANEKTGRNCLYFPNLSAPADQILEKAIFAKEKGAGGIMLPPGITGFDSIRSMADNAEIQLPILCHPAFLGSFVASNDSGVSHQAIFGQLPRLSGADATIYPNYGGRFSFSKSQCCSIVKGATTPLHDIKPIFSMPGGGMSFDRIPEMIETYGKDVIFLIGGNLHKIGPNLVENCKRYMDTLESFHVS